MRLDRDWLKEALVENLFIGHYRLVHRDGGLLAESRTSQFTIEQGPQSLSDMPVANSSLFPNDRDPCLCPSTKLQPLGSSCATYFISRLCLS